MRLRVLVGAAGTPTPVSLYPFAVLENGVTGARWTVADRANDDAMNEARAGLLRVLAAHAGVRPQPLQQVLVRLPRRLSGPRLHGGDRQVQSAGQRPWPPSGGWAEVIRWLRGARCGQAESPSAVATLGPDQNQMWLSWEAMYARDSGLGRPSPQRYPRRTRSRRGRSRKQRQREVELGLRPSLAQTLSAATMLPLDTLLGRAPAGFEQMAHTQRAFEDSQARHLRAEPFGEAPELTERAPDWMAPPTERPDPAPLTLRDLRRARAELKSLVARANPDGTYDAFIGPAAAAELRNDPEFQRLAVNLFHNNEDGFLRIEGLRLIERREPGWEVRPAPMRAVRSRDRLDPPVTHITPSLGVDPAPPAVHRFSLNVFGVAIRRPGRFNEATYIAARTEARARDLAARGYRNVYERHDGVMGHLPAGARHIAYDLHGEPVRTVVLDMTGDASSIEIPELDLTALVPIRYSYPDRGYLVRFSPLHGYDHEGRVAAISRTLAGWRRDCARINLRFESDLTRRQLDCPFWEVRETFAFFRAVLE